MATTDTRSGFRLPWSSDRSHDETPAEQPADASADAATAAASPDASATVDGASAAEAVPGATIDGSEEGADEPWPEIDVNARLSLISRDPETGDPIQSPTRNPEEPEAMVDTFSASAPAAAAAKKPSKLIADLAAAMRTTAEAAREQARTQVEADANEVVEAIRAQSTEGAAALRQRCEEDIAAIRDWSKAEIARIREETDRRVTGRKATLETEIAGHAAAIEQRVEDVQDIVAVYEKKMATFFERLLQENDPSRLATMAESMPEPPSLRSWADLEDLDIAAAVPEPEPEPVAAPEPEVAAQATAVADTADDDMGAAPVTGAVTGETNETQETVPEPEATADVDATAGPPTAPDQASPDQAGTLEPEIATEAEAAAADPTKPTPTRASGGDPWDDSEPAWGFGGPRVAPDPSEDGDEPGMTTAVGTMAPPEQDADRGAMLAALEAAAEAAAGSTEHAEAIAETTEGHAGTDEGAPDQETGDGSDAELDGDDTDTSPSLADRLASLLPGAATASGEATQVTTQVIVSGLVSVASIASFKRHMGRLSGVQTVSVASGPDGEFLFNVTHRSDVAFRDVIPTLPGFAARVTGIGDGIVNVTARDPDTEG